MKRMEVGEDWIVNRGINAAVLVKLVWGVWEQVGGCKW